LGWRGGIGWLESQVFSATARPPAAALPRDDAASAPGPRITRRVHLQRFRPSRPGCRPQRHRHPLQPAAAGADVRGAVLHHDPPSDEEAEGAQGHDRGPGQGRRGGIAKLGDSYLHVEVANGVELQVQRGAVIQVLPKGTFSTAK
jgi:hypothetical protein